MYINITIIEVGFYEFHEGVPTVEFIYLFLSSPSTYKRPNPSNFILDQF